MVSLNLPLDERVRQLEEELKHLTALNDAILCASGHSLIVVDETGVICSSSEHTPKTFGYEADDLVNQKVDIFVQDLHSSLDLSDHTRREARGIHKDGGLFQLEVGFAPITSKPGQTAILVKHVIKLVKRRLSPALRDASSYILDAAFDPMFCTDAAGIIAMVNQAAVNEFGWSREEFIGQNVEMIVGAEHQANHDSYMQHYIDTGEKKMIGKKREIQARRKDGTEFVAELGLAEIPQKDINEHIFCGFIRNLTKEKAAQAEILAKQRLTSKIIDASFDALFVINQNGIIQMVNEKSTEVLGWSREEFIGQNISMIMPEEHASKHDGYLARYLKTGIKHMMGKEREVEARCKDGRSFPCILGLTEVEQGDGGEKVFCGFIRSLAHEKSLEKRTSELEMRSSRIEEENIRNAEEILNQKSTILSILDASFDALFVITEERIIQMVNQKSCDVFGWTKEEFIGKHINMVIPEEHAHHDQYVQNYLRTGIKKMFGTQREVMARRKDGSTFPAALGMAEPQATGLICGFLRDLTQEKAAQNEILAKQHFTRKVIDASFDALFVINERGIIQMVNTQSTKALGWTQEEFIGQNISMIMPQEHASEHDGYLARYLKTGIKRMIGTEREVEARRKDGSIFPCTLGLTQVENSSGGEQTFCGFIRSLEREKALEKRQSELENEVKQLKQVKSTSKYGEAVEYIDALLGDADQDAYEKLALVKTCLIQGNTNAMHVPKNLSKSDSAYNKYIMSEFGGVKEKKALIHTAVTVRGAADRFLRSITRENRRRNRSSTANYNDIVKASNNRDNVLSKAKEAVECVLPEFLELDIVKKKKLYELLEFDNLKRWGFNIFEVAEIDEKNTLLYVAWAVILSPYSQVAMINEIKRVEGEDIALEVDGTDDGYYFLDLLDLAIDYDKLCNYFRLVQADYKNIPYHNSVHAGDVVQTLNSLIQMTEGRVLFDEEDLFVLLVSSVVHDVKHPGKNNNFQVKSFSDLSLNWNDVSVLENEHVSHAFKLMIQEDNADFLSCDKTKLAAIRKKMIDAVLHTDMTKHFVTVDKIKSVATNKAWEELDLEIRWEVLMYMLHLADISNPAKGDPMFKLWTDRCLEEFFSQGDKEKSLGLDISPQCDRATTQRPDSQIGFIKYVVKPAYEVLGDVIPGVKENILPVIESNLTYWSNEKEME